MHEELKARLLAWTKTSSRFGLDSIGKDIAAALEAIEQLELQLAERDAEIAKLIEAVADHVTVRAEQYVELQKYRDAPVVAWKISFKSPDTPDGFLSVHYHGTNAIADYRQIDPNAVCEHLIVKPGE